MDLHCTSWGKEGGLAVIQPLAGPLLGDRSSTVQQFLVYGNTEQNAGAWTSSFQPTPLLQCLGTLPYPSSSILCVTPGDPETTLSHLGFGASLPPEHLPGRLLKVSICTLLLIARSRTQLMEALSPCSLFSNILPWIHFSSPPTLQKVVTSLFVAILLSGLWVIWQVFRMIW